MNTSLKNITNIITGHVFRHKIQYSSDGNVNLINMESILTTGNVAIGKTDTKRVVATNLKEDEIIRPGDILFKAKGLNNNAVLIYNIPDNTTVTASCHIIRIADTRFMPEYVCTWLNSSFAKSHFSKAAGQATGVTIANVSKATLETLKIPIIPIKEQTLIANIYECAKQEYELQIKIAKQKRALYSSIIEKELKQIVK